MRPDVGERARRAAELLVDAPVVVGGMQQPVLQVAAVDQADRPALPGAARARAPPAPWGSSDRRTAPRSRARTRSPRRASPRRRDRRAPAASRRSRACRLRARPRASGRCRWFGVQMWTTSTSGDSTSSSADGERPLRPQRRGRQQPALGRGRGDADQACSRQPRRASVNSTHEPRPRDGDANFSSRHDRGS